MNASQKRAVARHRSRLAEQGLARYEVRGLAKDKELIRGIAKRLAQDDPEAGRLRGDLIGELSAAPSRKGGFLALIRTSPLVGADLNLERDVVPLRDLEL